MKFTKLILKKLKIIQNYEIDISFDKNENFYNL